MTERVVTAVDRGPRGTIRSLCNPREDWSPLPRDDAVRDIQFGLNAYYVGEGTGRTPVRVVHGRSGSYLRTVHDRLAGNNLDNLPDCTGESPITGASDLSLEVTRALIGRLMGAMHAAQVMTHHAERLVGDTLVEFAVACPEIEALELLPRRAGVVAFLPTRFYCWARRGADATDPGGTAVVEATIRATVRVEKRNDRVEVTFDWQSTKASDLRARGGTDAVGRAARAAVLDFVRSEGRGSYDVAALGSAFGIVDEIVFDVPRGGQTVAAGLNVGRVSGGRDGPSGVSNVGNNDWALALSRNYVLGQLRDALRRSLGSLPPPHGAAAVKLEENVYLNLLDVGLIQDAVTFVGVVQRRVDPVITASFTGEMGVRLTPAKALRLELTKLDIEIQEWYGKVADYLSSGSLTAAVRRGIRDALFAETGSSKLSSLLSPQALRELLAAGTARQLNLSPALDTMTVSAAGIVLRGGVPVPAPVQPQLAPLVLPSRTSIRHRILHGLGSFVPGAREISWEWLVDGQPVPVGCVGEVALAPGNHVVSLRLGSAQRNVNVNVA